MLLRNAITVFFTDDSCPTHRTERMFAMPIIMRTFCQVYTDRGSTSGSLDGQVRAHESLVGSVSPVSNVVAEAHQQAATKCHGHQLLACMATCHRVATNQHQHGYRRAGHQPLCWTSRAAPESPRIREDYVDNIEPNKQLKTDNVACECRPTVVPAVDC